MRDHGDLPKVLGAAVICLSIGLLTVGSPQTLFFALGLVFLWVAELLLLAELMWGFGSRRHRRIRRKSRDASYPDNQVLRVMREVMKVRPEPFSGAPR